MDDAQTFRSMVRDDAYRVVRVLKDGPAGKTELVTLDGESLLVRKRMPSSLANAAAWATAMEVDEPRLPRIESLYRMPDELVVVYTYVEGETMAELVANGGLVPTAKAISLMGDVCQAVTALHERGVVHRDITPGNVVVARDGAHLVDLGIARIPSNGQKRDTHILGTYGFAAPEQFGFAQTDARADIYALGKLLGYLLTGVDPGGEAYDTRLADSTVVPSSLAAVIAKATAFEPGARYQNVQEFASALQNASSASEPPKAPVTAATPVTNTELLPVLKGLAWLRSKRPLSFALLMLAWFVLGMVFIFMVATEIAELRDGFPHWGPFEQLVAGAICIWCISCGRGAYHMATRQDKYATGENILLVMLRELGLKTAAVIAFFCLLVVFKAIISGPTS